MSSHFGRFSKSYFVVAVSMLICHFEVGSTAVIEGKANKYLDSAGNCRLPHELLEEIRSKQSIVNHIANEIVNGSFAGNTFDSLISFVDTFGPRMSSTQALEDSIDFLVKELHVAGLENVHTESAPVLHWERNEESATLLKPFRRKLNIAGLGSSVGTPGNEGINADVLAVRSFAEFDGLDARVVEGKIVLFATEWDTNQPPFTEYIVVSEYRLNAAVVAAKKGAVAVLVRSATPLANGSPHTGINDYVKGIKHIPTAALAVEDSEMMLRMFRRGTQVRINLKMGARLYENPFNSRNTIAELQGTEKVNTSVVVVSGHLDSWDTGVGAVDNGGGAFISWKSIEFLKKMNLRPKRTIRAILWTGEEQGYQGSNQYYKDHHSAEEFNYFIESDGGTFKPSSLGFSGSPEALCIFREVIALMTPLNATKVQNSLDSMSDSLWWIDRGFPGSPLLMLSSNYFDYHHSEADTILQYNSVHLDMNTALFAATAYVLADLSVDIPKELRA